MLDVQYIRILSKTLKSLHNRIGYYYFSPIDSSQSVLEKESILNIVRFLMRLLIYFTVYDN